MAFQEKRALVSAISSLLILGFYSLYIFNNYHDVLTNTPNDFKFWGKAFMWLIAVTIVAQIVIHILFFIINKIVTNEDAPDFSDERDKLIELKAARVSHWIFILGFFLAMGSQALGMQPWVMFVTLIVSGFVAGMADEMTKIYYYRKGV